MSLHEHVAGDARSHQRRDARGRYLPGISGNPRGHGLTVLKLREKVAELRATFGPGATFSMLDESRLLLAAKHLEIARKSRDPNTSVRSANCAERLLSLIARPAEKPKTIDEQLREGGIR